MMTRTKILLGVLSLPILLVGFVGARAWRDTGAKYPDVTIDAALVPKFTEVALPFVHRHDGRSLPMMGAAVIDLDGDGVHELFLGGGRDQQDALFRFEGGQFVPIDSAGLKKDDGDTTFGAAIIDADGDGRSDLFVARDSGVYLYTQKRGALAGSRLAIELDGKSVAISLALTDLNHDGWVDIFAAAYLKKEKMEGQNIFNKEGYGTSSDAGDADLVVAHDTGQVRTWRNLLRNDGGFTFTNTAEEAKIAGYEFSWGAVFEDFNLDGLQDLLVAENYVGFPPHKLVRLPGRLLMQRPDHTFAAAEAVAGIQNPYLEISPLVADFDNNGRPDLVRVNLNGPARVHQRRRRQQLRQGARARPTALTRREGRRRDRLRQTLHGARAAG